MFHQITKILRRFFAIFGGYSLPEDLRPPRIVRPAAKGAASEPPKR